MSWLKMGRWLLVGVVGLNGAAACGGRGNLPAGAGEGVGDTTGDFGGSSTAGGSSVAGRVSFGGATTQGGVNSFGGTTIVGGSAAVGGVGGMPGVCKPGLGMCQGNAVAICNTSGTGYGVKTCATGQVCVQAGSVPRCEAQVCTPGQTQCDPTGGLVQVCAPDGKTLKTTVDCTAQGQRCQAGMCRGLVCQPKTRFCDKSGVRLCNADGSGSTPLQNCTANQFCDAMSLTCRQGVCAPGQPTCNGTIATTCNATGSGFTGVSFDCAKQLDRQCVFGACVCAPDLADCDSLPENGCEISIATDPDNCAGCGVVCSANHMASRTCDNVCDGTCKAGFQDCNGDKQSDGCEINVGNDEQNCGGCGIACSTNHVKASCLASTCSGACAKNFNDCNADKQFDGCESDSLTDVANCGGCGITCSTNHVNALCTAGACGGACVAGFADCNANKQSDGCEVNTLTDAKNCGSCGSACPAGQSCSAGKCSALLSFSGVAQNLSVSSLNGWSLCFSEAYGQEGTSLRSVEQKCSGSQLMLACRVTGSDTLQLAAMAPRSDVLFDVGVGDVTHSANGVAWYFTGSQSWGFAPDGDIVTRGSCDTQDGRPGADGVDGDKRLCWHTGGSALSGGWRCGKNVDLNSDFGFERLIFQAQ